MLKGIGYNPSHRKFGVLVSSLGKFIAVGGMIISGWPQWIIIASVVLAILMTVFAYCKHFVADQGPKEVKGAASSEHLS